MKRIKMFTMAVIIFLLSVCSPRYLLSDNSNIEMDSVKSYRDIPGVTEEEISAVEALIEKHGRFTYGHLLETEAFELSDGTYAGFTIELCKLLSEMFDADFSPQIFNEWSEMKAALDSRELDFSGGLMRTEERLGTYCMTMPIAGRSLRTYVLKDDNITSPDQLIGKKIGTLNGSSLMNAVKEHYPAFSFETVVFKNYDEGVKLLEAGGIAAIIATSAADPRLMIYDTIVSGDFFSLAYHPMSISTANSDLRPIISVIDKYLEVGGVERFFALYEEGEFEYKQNSLRLSLTEEERDYLDKMRSTGQRVNIGLQHDAYPASFYNSAEKEYQGVSIDILKEITKLNGLEFGPLFTSETTSLATILEKLKTGEISMMTQLLKTESRKNDYIWSDIPYLRTNYALLSRADYPDVPIHQVPWERVGTVDKSAHEIMFDLWFPKHPNRVVYTTTNEAFDALEKGDIDLLMLSENMLLQQTNLRQKIGFKVNLKFDVQLDSFFGFSKNEEVLRNIVDKSMRFIDIDRIASVWMDKVFDYESELAKVRSKYLMYLVCGMLVALVAVLFLFFKNKWLSNSLMERSATISTIYASIPDIIFSKNKEGVYTGCNAGFERQVGLTEKEIIGKTFAEIFKDRSADTVAEYREIDKAVMNERIINIIEEDVVFFDGRRRLLETMKAPLVQNGEVVGIIGMSRDITERKEIKSRLDSIINAVQIAFIITIDGIIMEANDYFREHIGAKIGDDIRLIYENLEQRDEVLGLVERYGTSSNNILNIKTAAGEMHRFLTSITLTEYEQRTAHIVWALDVEQDERRGDLLRELQISFHAVLDILPMPIRIINLQNMEIVYVNSSLLELLEYDTADELCGKNLETLLPDVFSDGLSANEYIKIVENASDAPGAIEIEYRKKTGEVIEVVSVDRRIDYNGRSSSIGIIKDLTEEKERAQILLNAAEREKEANQAKTLFLANMSHEIRTPMNGIIGMTDLLMCEKLTERQRQYAKDIKASAESLLSIINDILDLSKITEGKLQIVPVDIDLSMMLKNTVSMMRFSAQTKGLDFIDDINVKTPEYVCVDDVRLQQIIINLLSNAIKFTKNGTVKLMVKIEDGNIIIEVSDTGAGIKEEEIPLIFSAFEQADKLKNRAIKGTGLGLSITKNLVKLMEGSISVESDYGVGTTFTVMIPYVEGDEANVDMTDTKFEYIFAPEAQILLADDIQTNLTVGAGLLRLCGITADVALSGMEAIEYVKEKEYDIVFMDHMMPGMDGIETMNIIRGLDDKYLKLPIIALTANAVNESRAFLLSSGMDDFLSKPIDKIELMSILKKWLPEGKVKNALESRGAMQNVQYPEVLLAASKVDGLDVELALSRIGGLHDVLESSIKQVAFSIDEKLISMDTHLVKGDLSSFAMDAHGLKGALANIGAMKNSELAAALEIGAKAENMPLCTEKFVVFAGVMGEFAARLKEIFKEEEPAEKKPSGDKRYLNRQILMAINYLDGFEASDAVDCLNQLAQFTFGEENDSALKEAISAVERYKYNDAIVVLKSIL